MASATSPYRPFPTLMNTFITMDHAKGGHLYGASESDRLFKVEWHTGLSGKTLLGTTPGVILHNGPSKDDPVLAAACEESPDRSKSFFYRTNAIILLPGLDPDAKTTTMAREKMVGHTTPDNGVAFSFSVEVGAKMQREKFEWKKVKKGADSIAKRGGFKLIRLGSVSETGQSSHGTGTGTPLPSDDGDDDGETVAVLEWGKNSLFLKRTWSVMHGMSLQLTGSGKLGQLGERWTIMVVVTALRLDLLHRQGRDNHDVISVWEKKN